MPKAASTSNTNAKQLQLENQKLREENAALKKRLGPNNTPKHRTWQHILMWFCVALAAAILVVGNVFFWLGNTVVNTDKFTATVGPVIQQPSVQTALAGYTTTQIFSNYDVQGFIQSVLPPRAAFLAPQLTSQVKSSLQSTINKILASPQFQKTWATVLQKNHNRLITFAKNYQGNGTINVSDIYNQLSKQLESTSLSFLANKQLPAKVSSIQITTVAWLPALHDLSNNIGLYQAISTVLLIGLSAVAIWLANIRRRMVITLSILFSIMMIVSLLAIRITKAITISKVHPTYQTAVGDMLNVVFHPLQIQTYTLFLASILVGLVAWLSGPYKSASLFRDRIEALLAGKLHQSVFGKRENGLTRFVGRHKRQLQWGSVAVVAIIMLFVTLSPLAIVLYALLILVLVFIFEFLAA